MVEELRVSPSRAHLLALAIVCTSHLCPSVAIVAEAKLGSGSSKEGHVGGSDGGDDPMRRV